MSNAVHSFKDRDIKRVIKAARSSGINPVKVSVNPKTGTIEVYSDTPASEPGGNPWEGEIQKLAT